MNQYFRIKLQFPAYNLVGDLYPQPLLWGIVRGSHWSNSVLGGENSVSLVKFIDYASSSLSSFFASGELPGRFKLLSVRSKMELSTVAGDRNALIRLFSSGSGENHANLWKDGTFPCHLKVGRDVFVNDRLIMLNLSAPSVHPLDISIISINANVFRMPRQIFLIIIQLKVMKPRIDTQQIFPARVRCSTVFKS